MRSLASHFRTLCFTSLIFTAAVARAQESYSSITLEKLTITEGSLPANGALSHGSSPAAQPYVILEGGDGAEAYLATDEQSGAWQPQLMVNRAKLVVKSQKHLEDLSGTLVVPKD